MTVFFELLCFPVRDLLADAIVLLFIKDVAFFIQDIGNEHKHTGQDCHDNEQSDGLAGMDAFEKSGDRFAFCLGRDRTLIRKLLLLRDAVCILQNIENDLRDVRDSNGKRGSQFCKERTERGHDAFIAGAML